MTQPQSLSKTTTREDDSKFLSFSPTTSSDFNGFLLLAHTHADNLKNSFDKVNNKINTG
jgi:hypothetical protein